MLIILFISNRVFPITSSMCVVKSFAKATTTPSVSGIPYNKYNTGSRLTSLKIGPHIDPCGHPFVSSFLTLFPGHLRVTCYNSLNCSANYISLILEPGKGVYEYEVKFAPEVDAMNVRFQLISSLFGRKRTFDGTILYLPQKLDEEIKIYNETTKTGLQVTITIIFKRQKRLGECVHLYNVLFKRIMVVLDLIRHGRNHYNPKEAQVIPQYKLEVWPGYVTAVDEYEGGIQLCFDASHRVLRTQTVLDTMREYVSKYPTNFKDELFKAVIGQSVLTRYNNKLYRVDDLMWNKTPGDTFEKHGKLTTFADYYKDQYDLAISDMNQPLLVSRVKSKFKDETREQIVCLVPEFCYLTGLTDSMRNDYQLMKSIAMYTRITPNQRQMALQKFINNVNLANNLYTKERESHKITTQLGWGEMVDDKEMKRTRDGKHQDVSLDGDHRLRMADQGMGM
ncbi:unnamed protein product [Timema podura]|uniref:PAZ domain-containing protein n=1 Tax=Timema podura TaxID=61482 RepID=A0ABN7NYE3_TIMPD|nr:unnamed protein product [Timema podura]